MQLIPTCCPGAARFLRRALRHGVIFGLLALVVTIGTLRVAPVRGASMEPTLHDGQLLWYQSLPQALLGLRRGEIVVFQSPVAPGHRYVKRLVGLPGDELRFESGQLRVNGLPIELPASAIEDDFRLSTRVPDGCFYAIGDHGAVSYDSRRFGAISFETLVGKVFDVPPNESPRWGALATSRP